MPSADGARRLREELTRLDPDTGVLRHDFTDPNWDTRFLGDLYQDLSEHAKKTYALLQTPEFVEEFILDRTVEPAIATFGLADTTIIDPTCGSGHFLLGAFRRLFDRWVEASPSTPRRELAQRTLDAIGGIDLNPFAASITRFRLLLAALQAGGDTRLANAPAYGLQIAVGDSLLHGDPPDTLPGLHTSEEEMLVAKHGYDSEDVEEARELLGRAWSAVVGNPPYIAVADPALRRAYKGRFDSCHGRWTLGLPFMERFWQLAAADERDPERSGYVGVITDNSFMKREKGKRLVERWVPRNDITHVLDTSGVPIPGHGTGSVILFGRNRRPRSETVRALLKKADDPRHTDGEASPSWQALLAQLDQVGTESAYFSAVDFPRASLRRHPWSIGGGGAADLKQRLDDAGRTTLGRVVDSIGFASFPGTDDAFVGPAGALVRAGFVHSFVRPFVTGEAVRDWLVYSREEAFAPYDETLQPVPLDMQWGRSLWPVRTVIWSTTGFGNQTRKEAGEPWWTWYRWVPDKYRTALSIAFASVATSNHFVLDRGGKVFKQSAPVIKLPAAAGEDRHHEFLHLLNSSTACFWMKQVAHQKGGDGVGRGIQDEAWETRYDFDSTKISQFPLPPAFPQQTAALLDDLAVQTVAHAPASIVARETPTAACLAAACKASARIQSEMIAAQERLDWECYRVFGLIDDDLTTGGIPEPLLQLGERAFEILLARQLSGGERNSSWFDRHRSTPRTTLPDHWSPEYRSLVERRMAAIESNPDIGLIEQPEFKRRWASKPWDEQVSVALRTWLLARLEEPRYWPEPAAITTVARLTAAARADDDFVQVARLFAGREDVDLAALIAGLVKGESVAYLAAYRYTESGLRKYAEWLKTWELQRREDAGVEVGAISVPPKYARADFLGAGWDHRGKLDVPKERFISYPGAEREADASLVIGWAGWNHLDRARALAAWYLQARRDGRDAAHLTPLLAGLAELVPRLKQWYDEPNADPALDRPGTQIAALVDTELRSLGLTVDALTAWRPEKKRAGRPRKAAT
jgi:hypothetical protein